MNYSQFLNMIPEAFLVLSLILVFVGDFCLLKSENKNSVLSKLTAVLLIATACVTTTVEPTQAFGGIYVTSQMVNVMKIILTIGTFIVVVMAQTWLKTISTPNRN